MVEEYLPVHGTSYKPFTRIADLIIDRASLDRAQIVTDIVSDINATIKSSESLPNGRSVFYRAP